MGVFVPIWLVLPRCEATNLGVFVLCHFALISPYSNGAVQIRVGLELAEKSSDFVESKTRNRRQKGTPGRRRDRKCHDGASLSPPLVLSLGPLTSLTSFPLLLYFRRHFWEGAGGGGL